MRKFYTLLVAILFALTGYGQTQTVTFNVEYNWWGNATTNFTWKVPCGVTSIKVETWGAGGGGSYGSGGGGGGYNTGTLSVTEGQILNIIVGAGGAPGGNGGNSSVNGLFVAGGGKGATGTRYTNSAPGNGGTGLYSGGKGGKVAYSGSAYSGGGGGGSAFATGNGGNGANASSKDAGGNGGTGTGNGGNGASRSPQVNAGSGQFPGGGGGGRASNGGGSGAGADGVVTITYSGITGNYCNADFWRTRAITLVQFAGINRSSSSANDSEGYEYFCDKATVNQGGTYTISVKGKRSFQGATDYYTVFIDWNGDGNFNGVNEKYNIGTSDNSNTVVTGNITVPVNAQLGFTKMRIIKNFNEYPANGCFSGWWGQVEDYIVEVTGVCQQPTGATANDKISLTVCEGTTVTLRQTGGYLASGQVWKWYINSPSGTLVGTSTNADASITVTPNANTTYYVRAEGGNCGTSGTGATVTVNVSKPASVSHGSGSLDQLLCTGSTFQSVVFNLGGGATNASVSGLPNGLSGTYNAGTKTYTISGTPTQAGTFEYTVTTTGGSPCVNATITGKVTVLAKLNELKYSGTNKFTFCKDGQITMLVPSLSGGTASSYSLDPLTPTLPAGLSLDPVTGIISGTPTALQSATNYTIIASNGSCTTSVTITITVTTAGAQSFNVIPAGNHEICSQGSSPILIKLDASEAGKSYQLYRDGIAVGSPVPGDVNGGQISFGSHSTEGIYSIRTTDACATQMNGTVNISVTPMPNTIFTYENGGVFCADEETAIPTFSGNPQTGVFTSTTGLIINQYTGEIDLENSTPGTYTVTYTIAASGGCALYSTSKNITINSPATVFDVQGGGEYCVGTGGVPVTLSGSQTGISYQLYRNGNPVGTPVAGTGNPISFGNQTQDGNYTVVATNACGTVMNGSAPIIGRPVPTTPVISANPLTICEGTVLPLFASAGNPVVQNNTVTFSSNQSKSIPDNNANGAYIPLSVSGIPGNAVITEVLVTFNISHNDTRHLIVNLKGPNNNVLNVATKLGNNDGNNNSNRKNFTNTRINTTATNSIAVAVAPFNNVYKAEGTLGVAGAEYVINNVSNVTTLGALLEGNGIGANGVWILSVRDVTSGTSGTFTNWSIQISYTTISNSTQVTWSSATDLFSDPSAENAYVANTAAEQVFFKPSSAGSKTYTATSTNQYGCTASSTKTINVIASPKLTMAADYCADIQNSKIVVTATNNSGTAIDGASWMWSAGYDDGPVNTYNKSEIKTKTSGTFHVSALGANGCPATGTISIAQELVVNGDFEEGDLGFESDYLSAPEMFIPGNYGTGLYPEDRYAVHNNPQDYHKNFWGTDHTRADGTGKFMLVNGYRVDNKVIWRQTVTVLPNTKYYFSAYAVSLNSVSPYANLRFQVNGAQVGTSTGPLDPKAHNNNPGNWKRFYGEWESNSATTAVIEIINLQTQAGGNDFGLDDISFGTLSTFFNLKSPEATTAQVLCADTDLDFIAYEAGGKGDAPSITWTASNPGGVTPYWNGRDYRLSGKPATPGTYTYSLSLEVCDQKYLVRTGTIDVKHPSDAGTFKNAINNAIPICYNSSGQAELQNTYGDILKWEYSSDQSNWTSLVNSNTYYAYNNLQDPIYLRAYALQRDNSGNAIKGCEEAVSEIVKLGIKNMWEGNNTSAWGTAGNWSFATVPDPNCDYVIVPDVGAKPYPVLSDARQVNNLIIRNNASVTVANNGVLKVSGAITNIGSGKIDSKAGTMEFNGTAAQTISSAMFKDTTISKLVVSNNSGLTVSSSDGALAIAGKLSFGTSNAKITTGDNLTLKSTKQHTASLGIVGTNNSIQGKMTVERYINVGKGAGEHGKKWIVLATNTNGQTIKESWMEGGLNFNSTGYGIMLSGPEGTAGGWDMSSPSPAIKHYVPATGQGSWKGATGANVQLKSQEAWMVFVRGDRSVTGQWDAPKPTTLRSKGTVFTGSKTVNIPAIDQGFFLVGNPYPSSIDLTKVTGMGTTGTYYVWNPNLGGIYGLGAYQTFTYDNDKKHYVSVPSKDTLGDIINSGQAFFVQTSTSGGSITFDESNKVDESDNQMFFRPNGGGVKQGVLRSNIVSGAGVVQDGILQIFSDEFSNGVDLADGRKMINTGINLSVKVDKQLLVVERRQYLTAEDTIQYNLTGTANGKYSFALEATDLDATGLEGWFEDAFTGQRQQINLEGVTNISFDVTSAAASKAANRFRIVFKAAYGALPVTFVKVDAVKDGNDVKVKWDVANEINLKQYVVMRSADGNNFSEVGKVRAEGKNAYSINDRQPLNGYNYYRIKSVDLDGTEAYSPVAKVWMGEGAAKISVFPNPIVNGIVNLKLENMSAGKYHVRLLNPIGQVILTRDINHPGGNYSERIPWDYNMAHGTYQLEVNQPDGGKKIIRIMY